MNENGASPSVRIEDNSSHTEQELEWPDQCRTKGSGNSATAGLLLSGDTPEKLALEVPIQMEQSTLVREPGRMTDLHFLWYGQRLGLHSKNTHLKSRVSIWETRLSEPSQGDNTSLWVASQGQHEVGGSGQFLCAMRHAHLCLDVPTIYESRALLK